MPQRNAQLPCSRQNKDRDEIGGRAAGQSGQSGLDRRRGLPSGLPFINTAVVGSPQPIKAGDRLRLIRLCNPQSKLQIQSKPQLLDERPNAPLDERRPRPAAGDCLDGDSTSASVTGVAISKASVFVGNRDEVLSVQQQIQQQGQRLRRVERKLRSSLNLATVMGAAVVETAALFQARQVSLFGCDRASQQWQQLAQYCSNQTLAWQPSFALSRTEFPHLIGRLRQGYPVQISADLQRSRLLTQAEVDEAERWLTGWPGSWLLLPVKRRKTTGYSLNAAALAAGVPADSDHWGIMALAYDESQTWSEAAIAMSQSIAVELEWAIAQAGQHQELMLANQELQKLALSDGLTRLANRRRFDEHLSDEWQRLARDRQPLSLILCDLDHFKRYNDTFGHPAGDRCLIRVARALLNGPQRPADLVARYGGEEFAVILPNTDTHGAWRIAQKIHENIRALKIEHAPDAEEKYVTVTMGVSTVVPGHSSTAQMLVQASDLALYHAKQQGRNRTYVHAHYNTVEDDFERGDGDSLDMTL